MKGQIEKRTKGTYRLRLFLGRDESGKRQRLSKTVHGTKKEAERALREWIDQYESGRLPTADKVTLNQFLTEWLDVAKATQVTPRTLTDYRTTLDTYLGKDLGRFPLGKLGVLDIQAHMTGMLEKGHSTRTVRLVHGLLSQALKCAVRWRKIPFNPAADVEKPRTNRKKKPVKALNVEQLALFLEAAQVTPYAVMMELAAASGARPGEYLGLGWECVDWSADGIRIERAAIYERGVPPYLGPPKTPESFRTIPLPKPLMQRLREHRMAQNEWRLQRGTAWDGSLNLVFPNQNGGIHDYHNVAGRGFKDVAKRAGLPKEFSLYCLRHTMATNLLLVGENPKVVQERLGHASIMQTLQTYSEVVYTMQRGAADKMGQLIYSPGGLGGLLGAKGTDEGETSATKTEEEAVSNPV